MSRLVVALFGAAIALTALASKPGFAEYRVVQESLRSVHPRFVPRWLADHGYDVADFMPRRYEQPDSSFLQLRGKWGRGRSVEVTGQDSFVFLSLGSEIAIVSFADPERPRIVTELQLGFCPTQTHVEGSLLVTGGYSCIETWGISDIERPVFRGRIPYRVGDFCVRDSFLYFVSYDDDSFRVFSLANPSLPYQLGACRDSGWATTVSGNTVVLVLHDGFGFMDVSNPRAPRRVGSYGGNSISATARGTICCVSNDEGGSPPSSSFTVLDISDPTSPRRLSKLDNSGGYDIYLRDSLAFVSGWEEPWGEFCIIDISDSTSPVQLGTCDTPGYEFGVWASSVFPAAFIASDERGLEVVDVSIPAQPALDTSILRADYAEDVYVDGNRAYVADSRAGLRILDVTNPAMPVELGGIDSLSTESKSVAALDSFAYVGWWQGPHLRSVSVADPARPIMAGGVGGLTVPEDMVLRDTLIYLAGRLRFNVVNVARPRQPMLVGSCVTADVTHAGLCLRDTIAYIAYWPTEVINVADPTRPVKIGEFRRGANNIDVVDTLAFLAGGGLFVYSVANPAAPALVDSFCTGIDAWAVVVIETLAFVGCRDAVRLMNVADPHNMRVIASSPVPQLVWKMTYAAPYVYAACFEAGMCIFEASSTGVADRPSATAVVDEVRLIGSVTRGRATLEIRGTQRKGVYLRVYDIAGNRVGWSDARVEGCSARKRYQVDLAGRPAGVYVLRVSIGNRVYHLRITKL